MTSLIISFLPLIAAPLLCRLCTRTISLALFMDGFLFVAIGGLIVSGVLPQAWLNGGPLVVVFLLLGLLLPVLSERVLLHVGEVHRVALILGLSGLLLHAVTDGAALSQGAGGADHSGHMDNDLLSMSVLLHRLPIGLTIWWLVYPQFGLWAASSVLGVIGLGTVLGFMFAPGIIEPLSTQGMAFFQAFVAGSLVHVLYHRPHASGAEHEHQHAHQHDHPAVLPDAWPEGVGNVLGGALVIFLASQHEHSAEWAWLASMEQLFLALALASAPLLLLAYVIAAGVSVWALRGSRRSDVGARAGLRTVALAMALGVCRPTHADGVIQDDESSATGGERLVGLVAFVSAALLGIEAMMLSLGLLGPTFTLLRIGAALVLVLLLSVFFWLLLGAGARSKERFSGARLFAVADPHYVGQHWLVAAGRAFLQYAEQGAPWVLLGVLCAAIIQPMLQDGFMSVLPVAWDVVLFALLGAPFHIRATAATPMLVVLLAAGVSPGAALAFLITGPLLYPRLLAALARCCGYWRVVSYCLLVVFLAFGAGFTLNVWWPRDDPSATWAWSVSGDLPWSQASLVLLASLYLYFLLRRGARAFVMRLFAGSGAGHQHH